MRCRGQRRRRWCGQRAREARREHDDAVGAERDGVGDAGVVGDAAVHQCHLLAPDRGEDGRDRGRRQNCGRGVARREENLLAAHDVGGHDVQGDACVAEVVELEIRFDQAAQRPSGAQRLSTPRHCHGLAERVEREDVGAPKPAPDVSKPVDDDVVVPVRSHVHGVQRADRCADEQVGAKSSLLEGREHADLHGTEASAPREHECGGHDDVAPDAQACRRTGKATARRASASAARSRPKSRSATS